MNGGTPLQEIAPGLYVIGVSPSSPSFSSPPATTYAYYLTQAVPSPADPAPTLDDTWTDADYSGWYLFLIDPIVDATKFVDEARSQLPALTASPSQLPIGIIWMPDPSDFGAAQGLVLYSPAGQPDLRTLGPGSPPPVAFTWGALTLTIGGARFSLDTAANAITISSPSGSAISLSFCPQGGTVLPYSNVPATPWLVSIPLTGDAAGTLGMTAALELGYLVETFGCGFRYITESSDDAGLYYTFVPPAAPSLDGTFLGFALQLHPLLPCDPAATRLAFDLAGSPPNEYQTASANVVAPYFLTTNGGSFNLVPYDVSADATLAPPGFAFCLAPGSSPSPQLYLAPSGTFQVSSFSSPGETGAQWLCGLTAQEYLQIETNDLVAFIAGMPAYAPGAGSGPAAGHGPTLDATFTTSWLQFPVASSIGSRSYFGMPSASIYYAGIGDSFGTPVVSKLVTFADSATFPIVPYGGIYASVEAGGGVPVFNAGVSPVAFASFESLVLSSERHLRATAGTPGPVFTVSSANGLTSAGEIGSPPPAGTALTPQGFVVQLNAGGTWAQLDLALSPETAGQYLSFNGTPTVVEPAIANVVLQTELFLVVTNPASVGNFSNEISVGGFNFTLGIQPSSPHADDGTLLIFKFNTTASLAQLAERTDLWADTATFVTDVAAAQQQIREAIEVARNYQRGAGASPSSGNPFAYFLSILDVPGWTGILALNCAIDGNGMPEDFQMLLGGIQGQLRAHHLGVERNRVTQDPDGGASLQQSSLFGVIHYASPSSAASPAESPAPLAYGVETLTVVFQNSQITQFNVVVGLTINELFGRETALVVTSLSPPPRNTLEIAGQYQVTGSIGVVTFQTDQAFIYDFPVPAGAARVLDHVLFDSASLVPVSSVPLSGGGTQMTAQFSLAGGIWFSAQPFPGSGDFDLFSYGNGVAADGGLSFTNMTMQIVFTLDSAGAMVPGSQTVTFVPSLLTILPSPGAIRSGSLLGALPLQLSQFLESPAGMTTSSLGANVVNCLQLEGQPSSSSPPLSPSESLPASPPAVSPATSPYVTVAPTFALEYDLPLGSLGSLSGPNAGLMAKLFLGWGPSTVMPGSDAAAVFVQLPQLSAGLGGGFNLQGILKTVFGDANLLAVDVDGLPVYALLFNNVQLSVLGYAFPPGVIVDFLLFAGQASQNVNTNTSNLAWFLGVLPQGSP